MDNLAQLERHANELGAAVRNLAKKTLRAQQNSLTASKAPKDPELYQTKRNILAKAAEIGKLVSSPADFLEHLASQSQLVACLRWLGEFQILACIPLEGSVPLADVAELSGVSENQLLRIIRLTATAGFLAEPQLGHVSHTSLSAPFVANPSLLDASMFLAEYAAPASLQITPATQRTRDSDRPNQGALGLTMSLVKAFLTACEERPKLSRQWTAYLHYAGGLHASDSLADILTQLNWANIGDACLVEVGANSPSTARSLVDLYPTLRFVVQISDSASLASRKPRVAPEADLERELSPRITVCRRIPGTQQTVTNAAVYILHPPYPPSEILVELQAHLEALWASRGVMLILTTRVLPEPDALAPVNEAAARSRDLVLHQLAGEGEIEMAKLLEMIDRVRDSSGKLVVTNRLRCRNGSVAALSVKYQAFTQRSVELQPV